ncbi:DENN domain-containing protein 3-like [Clytia hemisphaerica]|uniref:UDENN domain-containing protein n=1 Tax=Clytia hemisphaerica TaxID=252671 RepID=A0A7M5VF50_9CNID
MPRLRNTLVDACVVIGVDHNTDLTRTSPGSGTENSISDKIKYGPFKQHVLAVFTESLAYFPETVTRVEGEPFFEENQVICPNATAPIEASPSSGVRRSISHKPGTKRILPFSPEVTSSLPTFCYPDGGFIYRQPRDPDINYLVLTNMEGQRTYAVSMTFYCPFSMIESTVEKGQFLLLAETGPEDSFEALVSTVYVPICVCLVSLFPFMDTLKGCLSALIPQLKNQNINEIWRPIMKLATVVTTIPVPPPGPLAISFTLFGSLHVIHPPPEAGRRVVDIDLQLPILIFKPDVMIQIITCFLTQQRMVFVSSTYSLLTLIIEAIFTYLDPINWRLTYVPVLPNSLGDLVEAPGPFIMGVHSKLRSKVKQIRAQPETPSIVMVDIDKGTIDIDENNNVPSMPDSVAQSLLVRLRKASVAHQIMLASLPTKFTFEAVVQQRKDLAQKTNTELQETFLDMLVMLFGDVYSYMSFGNRYFDKPTYLQTIDDDDRPFYFEVLSSDAFERFIDERMENHERRDALAVLGEKMATQRNLQSTRSRTYTGRNGGTQQHQASVFKPVTEFFNIPMFIEESLSSGNFYRVYCNSLTKRLEKIDSKDIKLKAALLYLRGFAHIACDYPIEGLRDFHALYASSPDLFPRDFTAEVINSLDPNIRDVLQKEAFYKQTAMFRTFTTKDLDRKRNPSRKIPNDPMSKTDFEQRVKTLHKVILTPEQIDWLFNVLIDDNQLVSPESFRNLYKVLAELDKESENRDISGVHLDTKHPILKVSQNISTMKGMGRLVLTTELLYFIQNGARDATKITQVIDIKEIIKYNQQSLFAPGVQAVRIINSDRNIPPFQAALKEERDIWLCFMKEISAAQKSAIALRDNKLIEQGRSNILLAQALLELQFPLKTAEGACFFSRRAVDAEGLSDDTKDCLEMRLDPCVRESKRYTVMCIAYVPGNPGINDTASIWCGLGSGTIMVYETDAWNCVSELRYAKSRLSCLSLIDNNRLWAGSFDSVIYVINTDTRKSEQQLQNHTDFVSDVVKQEKSSGKHVVWSSSFNGQIMCWDAETRENIHSFTLKKIKPLSQIIPVNETTLWCVTADKILIVDVSAEGFPVLQKLNFYDQYEKPSLLEYALMVNDEEIWVGLKTQRGVVSWNTKTYKAEKIELTSDDEVHLCCMIRMLGSVWVGNRDGKVFVVNPDTRKIELKLHAHTDFVKSMCVTREGHVVTGSSSKEGKVCVWNAMFDIDIIDGTKRKKKLPEYEFVEKGNIPEGI